MRSGERAPRGKFAAERPVGQGDDVLFKANKSLNSQLERIADHILSSANGGSQDSFTFLISGKWGTGKSSALRHIGDQIKSSADGNVLFVTYQAPLYETKPASARATLMYELIRAVENSGDIPLTDVRASDFFVRSLLKDFSYEFPSDVEEPARSQLVEVQRQLLLIEALEHSTRSGMVLEHWLAEYQATRNEGGRPKTMVVIVDDLDRCSSQFAIEVLAATNYWSRLNGHFFVLGAEEARLKAALAEHLDDKAIAPDRGLRKYVHVTVELPPTIEGAAQGKPLFQNLLEQIELDSHLTSLLTTLLSGISDHPQSEPWALLEPLVNPHCTSRPDDWTPRRFKEVFNAFCARIDAIADAGTGASPIELAIKTEIIKLMWPSEWTQRVHPASLKVESSVLWCRHFTELGAAAVARPRHGQRQEVVRLAEESGLILLDTDPLLAVYLASDPPYLVDPSVSVITGTEFPAASRSVQPEAPISQPPAGLAELTEFFASEAALPAEADRGALGRLLGELEIVAGLKDRDDDRVRSLVGQVMERLRAGDELRPGLAAPLGNCAIQLGRRFVPEAAQLHVLAVRADPHHANVNQNFVDFVVDHPIPQLLALADEALDRLERDPAMASWRPLTTKVLRAALDNRLGRPPGDAIEALVADATEPGAEAGMNELVNLMGVVRALRRYRLAAQICGAMLERERGRPAAQVSTVRMAADAISRSDRADDEEFAGELYRFLLASGLLGHFEDQASMGETLYNYGALCHSRGFIARAGRLFFEGYRRKPEDDDIRLRLARWYNDNGQPGAAEALVSTAVAAEDLPTPPGPPFDREQLPPSGEGQAWISEHLDATYGPPFLPELNGDSETS